MIPRQDPKTRTAYNYRCSRTRIVFAIVIIVALICSGGLKLSYSVRALVMPDEHRPSFVMASAKGDLFTEWFNRDMDYLTRLIPDNGRRVHDLSRLGIRIKLSEELRFLKYKIKCLQDNPDYTHPALGFHVYDVQATGWLHVLYKAAAVRENLLSFHLDRRVIEEASISELSDGTPLYEASSEKLPEVDEIVETLEGMTLPPMVFHDYRVYILPFSMGEISGLGAKGYMILGAPSVDCEVIENQTAFTVAHELGHHIHMTFLGTTYEDNPNGWDEYMKVRGIPTWSAGGDVNSKDWFESTEETFAEDIRVLFGTQEAASEPHRTIYQDPRSDPVISENLRLLLTNKPKHAKLRNKEYANLTSK